MSSRSLSPPRRTRRVCDDNHRAEPSMSSLRLRPRRPSKPVRKATSMPGLLSATAHVSRGHPSSPPPPPPFSDQSDLRTLPQPQYQVESVSRSQPKHQEESELELELDSPPRPIMMNVLEDEPGSPTSPPRCGSPPSQDMKASVSPTFGTDTDTDTEEFHFSDEEDPYFKSVVDNFTAAAEDLRKPTLPEDNIDYKACHQRQSDLYAKGALMHYNADAKNKVKYELIRAITSCGIVGDKGCYGHVNFTAKGNQENSEEELFFAELRTEDYLTFVPTCVLSLEGVKSVGGLCGTRYDNFNGRGMPIDAQHCYACGPRLKHPKNGALYKSGHVACGDFYHG